MQLSASQRCGPACSRELDPGQQESHWIITIANGMEDDTNVRIRPKSDEEVRFDLPRATNEKKKFTKLQLHMPAFAYA